MNIMNQLSRAAVVFVAALVVSGCVPSSPRDDGEPSAEEPSVSTGRLAASERFDPDQACDLLGIGAVPTLGETYAYDVLEPEPNETGCRQEIARLTDDDFRIRNVMVMGHGVFWERDEEAARASFQKEIEDSNSSLYNALEPELSETRNLESGWDEAVLVSAPDWEVYPNFRLMARQGPVILTYWITLSSNRPNDTECIPEMVEGCVIGYEIVSGWIENELLPEALANLQEAGYVDP